MKNGIAVQLFNNTSVAEVVPYDDAANLWIVKLAPQGYIILAGSDLCKPIVSFAETGFTMPAADTPLAALLARSAAAVEQAELEGGTREDQWDKLLALQYGRMSRSVSVDTSSIVVEPFVTQHWSQCQPYNDFVPVSPNAPFTNANRGRAPCGCVATALSQVMAYWQWPAWTGEAKEYITYTTNITENVNLSDIEFPIRFDGHVPFQWDLLQDSYPSYLNGVGYDLREHITPGNRYAVARLVLFVDALAKMQFDWATGSGAYIWDAVGGKGPGLASDWYETAEEVDCTYKNTLTNPEYRAECTAKMKAALQAKIPLPYSIPNHAIFAHGWAEESDGSNYYVYLNYGFDNNQSTWYSVWEGTLGVEEVYINFVPKKMVQVKPLPPAVKDSVTLEWALPNCYADDISGFTVTRQTTDGLGDWTDDFSTQLGAATVSYEDCVYVTQEKTLSLWPRYPDAYYTYSEPLVLGENSNLTFDWRSDSSPGCEIEVEVSNDEGKTWATLALIDASASSTQWTSQTALSLAGYQNASILLRFGTGRGTGWNFSELGSAAIFIDNVKITNTKSYGAVSAYTADKSARSITFDSLTANASYQFTVTPVFADGASALTSPAVQTKVVASGVTPAALPVIERVGSSPNYPAVKEGFYRECVIGSNVIWVDCSDSTTELAAHISHTKLIPDSQVQVNKIADGQFAIVVAAKTKDVLNHSRMILTLEATNADGAKAYKDLSLRFSNDEGIKTQTYIQGTGVEAWAAVNWTDEDVTTEGGDEEDLPDMEAAFTWIPGHDPIGWVTSWDGDNAGAPQTVVGTNGFATSNYVVYETSASDLWHPHVAMPKRETFTLVTYGCTDLVQASEDKYAVLWYWGTATESYKLALVKDSTGHILLLQPGGVNTIVQTLDVGPVARGYHLFTVCVTSGGGISLQVDDGDPVWNAEMNYVNSDGLKIGGEYGAGAEYGQSCALLERGDGFIVCAMEGYNTATLTDEVYNNLYAKYPAVSVSQDGTPVEPEPDPDPEPADADIMFDWTPGENPTGWLTGWDGANGGKKHTVIGIGGTLEDSYMVFHDGESDGQKWHPFANLSAKNNFTLATYGCIDQLNPDSGKQGVLWCLGKKDGNKLALIKNSDGELQLLQVVGGVTTTISAGKVQRGYHLFTVRFDTTNGASLQVDDGSIFMVSTPVTTPPANGFQVGAVYQGLSGNFVRGVGFIVKKMLGFDTASIPDTQYAKLCEDYPAVLFADVTDTLPVTTQAEAEAAVAEMKAIPTAEDLAEGVLPEQLKLIVKSVEGGVGYQAVVVLNPDTVTPPSVSALTPPADDTKGYQFTISDAIQGLWYGYEFSETLKGTYENDVDSFSRATADEVDTGKVIEATPRTSPSGFFRVKVLPAKPQ